MRSLQCASGSVNGVRLPSSHPVAAALDPGQELKAPVSDLVGGQTDEPARLRQSPFQFLAGDF